jgi:acetolactate decarboxylase
MRLFHSLGRGLVCVAGFLLLTISLVQAQSSSSTLFQYSAINALLAGVYEGDMTIAQLAKKGDTGLGTINHIDGELIAIDGQFFAIKADGKAHRLPTTEKTPFAVMAFIDHAAEYSLASQASVEALEHSLDDKISAKNSFQLIRIDGEFEQLTVRSEPKQSPPYRPLVEVMKEQQVSFELNNVNGSMIGFRTPDYITGVNVPGYHFHFISDDHSRGGHVLKLSFNGGQLRLKTLTEFEMALPDNALFNNAHLGSEREHELKAVEQR